MQKQKHWYFGVGLLVALAAGAAAGIVASVSLARSLGDYATALVLSHIPTVATDTTPYTSLPGDDTLTRIANVASSRVASITAATTDSRLSTQWIAEDDAVGYGVVVATDGWVLTTDDTLAGFANPKTQANVWVDGVRYAVTQVVHDTLTDFALLKIDANNLTPAAFGASEDVQNGSVLYALEGTRRVTVTALVDGHAADGAPVVAAEKFAFRWDLAHITTVPSPVFTASGDVMALSEVRATLPIHTATTFVRSVLRDGVVPYAGFGAMVVDLSLPLNIDATLSQGKHDGALVMAFSRSSPAQSAGVALFDIVTAVDDVRVDGATTLGELLQLYKSGDRATLTVVRAGATQRIDVMLGAYESLVY